MNTEAPEKSGAFFIGARAAPILSLSHGEGPLGLKGAVVLSHMPWHSCNMTGRYRVIYVKKAIFQ